MSQRHSPEPPNLGTTKSENFVNQKPQVSPDQIDRDGTGAEWAGTTYRLTPAPLARLDAVLTGSSRLSFFRRDCLLRGWANGAR